ncbi:P-loop containing nucleoside triphosphate hydrolase protein [Aspergillus leporis]|uniref:P-loop containing nucleoside triphosphate hydrolase protein n=1 Tax=Aspergillus leporis TaxID=41062 RepID=A0A5N5WRX1_9EURO|nr:P-loop containing nucleoside triphosphate hydrolase protein [Aspergillus leporis]
MIRCAGFPARPDLNETRRFVAGTNMNFASLWENEDSDEKDLSEEDQQRFKNDPRGFWIKRKYLDKLRTIRYTPAPAHTHFFIYKGCWFALYHQPYKDAGSPWVGSMENSGSQLGTQFRVERVASKRPRPLSTIVLDHYQKDRLIKDVQEYLHPRTCCWYKSRGLPYQRGYLFYGPPGTGKSSLCLSANQLDENSLALLFQSLPRRCIVLFEGVDQAGIQKRKIEDPLSREPEETHVGNEDGIETPHNEQQSNGIILSAFLSVIDSVSAQEGRILIMTTNHIEQLDRALLRPGRVDMKVAFTRADQLAVKEHFLSFYFKTICAEWALDKIVNLLVVFADKVPPDHYTAAEIQNYLLQYRNDPVLAVHSMTE